MDTLTDTPKERQKQTDGDRNRYPKEEKRKEKTVLKTIVEGRKTTTPEQKSLLPEIGKRDKGRKLKGHF